MKSKKIIISIIIGVVLLMCSILGVLYLKKTNTIVTTITIDINPSLKLSLNYKDEIVKIEGLNEDGKALLRTENFKGDDLEDAIEEVAELAVEKGYVTQEENHILISVDGKDIKDRVVNLINKEFKEEHVKCNVIVQEVKAESKANAEKYNISESKASYIEDIIKENENVSFEELKDKSINEINEYIETKETEKRLEEEKKKQEEAEKKKEENKTSNKVNPSNSSSDRKGSTKKCESVAINLDNDDATAKVFADLGLDFARKNWYTYQTIASIYNDICAYETKLIHNKTLYKYYYNVTDGSLVHKEQTAYLAGTHADLVEIINNYLATNYGASASDVFVSGSGGTINEANKEADATYNGVNYKFIIEQRTGTIKSVTEG